MLCIGHARVGVLRRSWWAVWDGERLHEGTRDRFDLSLEPGTPIEVTTGPAWSRKTPLRVTGTALGIEFDAPGLLDESAGRHARHTAWMWSAGAGVAESGAQVVWNLVEGLHDSSPSERTVWVDGVPHEVAHQPFDGLRGVGDLRFTAVATRARRENYVLLKSDYEQPFGTFEGSLPVAGRLRAGWGVMERHEALW